MALFVVRNLLGELGHKVRALRPRADETHFAAQDVPELRNLVDARFAPDATDGRRKRIASTGPHPTSKATITRRAAVALWANRPSTTLRRSQTRSEEHTAELPS